MFPPIIIPTHLLILIISSTLFNLRKTAANVQEGTNWWEGDSGSGVQDVSSLAGREDGVVRVCSFGTLFITNFYTILITSHSSLSHFTLQDIHESSGGDSGVFAVVSWRDSVQGLAVSRRDEMVSSKVCSCT